MTRGERLRLRVLFGGLGAVPVFLAGWLGWLQVVQAGELSREGRPVPLRSGAADRQRDRSEVRPGPRGTILDRHGAALAIDCEAYEVRAEVRLPRAARAGVAELREHLGTVALRLGTALACDPGLADRQVARERFGAELLARLGAEFGVGALPATGALPAGVPRHGEVLVAGGVAVLAVLEALSAVDEAMDSLHLFLRHDHVRIYAARECTWGLVGHVEDVPLRDGQGRLLGFEPWAPVGLESMRALLPGSDGRRPYRVDARSRRFFCGAGLPAGAATRVATTIDLELQKLATRLLEEQALAAGGGGTRPQWGALVLVEIGSGDVLAAASWHRDCKSPRGAAFAPHQLVYEPGSVVKPLVFAFVSQFAGLDWTRPFDCRSEGSDHRCRVPELDGRTIRDDHACGLLDAHGILVESSNIGAVKVGSSLARDGWARWLDVFGFGRALALPLPHEQVGGPDRESWDPRRPEAQFRKWTGGSYSIGYELQVNALQVARAYLTLLNGRRCGLRLVREIEVDGQRHAVPAEVLGERLFDAEIVRRVTAAMADVVSPRPGATGANLCRAFAREGIELHGFLAGKTGTAASRSVVGGRTVEVRNASFVGFAPVGEPRYLAVCVLQKDDGARFYGGSYAAPPVARLLLEATRLEQRGRLRQEPQVRAFPGGSGRGGRAPEKSQAGR